MPERNASYLAVVYAKGEQLFHKLEELLETFRPWTALGYLEFEKF